MKTLTFGSSQRPIYEMLYQGLVYTQRPLDRAEIRVHSKILDKMETIGKPEVIEKLNKTLFTLGDPGGTVDLEDAEYELANRCLDAFPYRAELSREVASMLAFFEGAAKEPPRKE